MCLPLIQGFEHEKSIVKWVYNLWCKAISIKSGALPAAARGVCPGPVKRVWVGKQACFALFQ